jgi:hypothetical protein
MLSVKALAAKEFRLKVERKIHDIYDVALQRDLCFKSRYVRYS